MRSLGPILLVAAIAGCHAVEVITPPTWHAPVVECWRLTEREYGDIEDPWATAGDGNIAAKAPALLYEPVFRVEQKPSPRPALPRLSPCLHRINVRRMTPEGMAVGESAEIHLEIESFPNVGHLVRIAGAHPGIQVQDVRGASPLVGQPGAYAAWGAARVEVRFTSTIAGRGGIEVELLGEISGKDAPAPPDSLARRP